MLWQYENKNTIDELRGLKKQLAGFGYVSPHNISGTLHSPNNDVETILPEKGND